MRPDVESGKFILRDPHEQWAKYPSAFWAQFGPSPWRTRIDNRPFNRVPFRGLGAGLGLVAPPVRILTLEEEEKLKAQRHRWLIGGALAGIAVAVAGSFIAAMVQHGRGRNA